MSSAWPPCCSSAWAPSSTSSTGAPRTFCWPCGTVWVRAAGGGEDLLRLGWGLPPHRGRGRGAGAAGAAGRAGRAGRGAVSARTGAGPAGAPREPSVGHAPPQVRAAESRVPSRLPQHRGRLFVCPVAVTERGVPAPLGAGSVRGGAQRSLPAGRAPGQVGRSRPELSAPPRRVLCPGEEERGADGPQQMMLLLKKKQKQKTAQLKPRDALCEASIHPCAGGWREGCA